MCWILCYKKVHYHIIAIYMRDVAKQFTAFSIKESSSFPFSTPQGRRYRNDICFLKFCSTRWSWICYTTMSPVGGDCSFNCSLPGMNQGSVLDPFLTLSSPRRATSVICQLLDPESPFSSRGMILPYICPWLVRKNTSSCKYCMCMCRDIGNDLSLP